MNFKELATERLWLANPDYIPTRKLHARLKKLKNRDRFTKFILYVYGTDRIHSIIGNTFNTKISSGNLNYNLKSLYTEIKSIYPHKLTYSEFRAFIGDTQTTKIKSLGKKLAIFGCIVHYGDIHNRSKMVNKEKQEQDFNRFRSMVDRYMDTLARQKRSKSK